MGFLDKLKGKPKGTPDTDIIEADKIISQNHADFRAWNRKADALAKLGKFEEAIEAYNESIRLVDLFIAENRYSDELWSSKAFAIRRQGNILNDQGNRLVSQEKYEEAIKCYDEAIRLNPKESTYWLIKSECYKALGSKSAADEAYAVAVDLTKQNLGLSR